MSFEYLKDPAGDPAWKGVLPGSPEPYVLRHGEGEHSILFGELFTVLLSEDETDGQFGVIYSEPPVADIIPSHSHADTHETFYILEGKVRIYIEKKDGEKISQLLEPGDFGYVPAGLVHSYKVEEAARIFGVLSGGYERFFQRFGTPVDEFRRDLPPFIPSEERMRAVAERHHSTFLPDFTWPDA